MATHRNKNETSANKVNRDNDVINNDIVSSRELLGQIAQRLAAVGDEIRREHERPSLVQRHKCMWDGFELEHCALTLILCMVKKML